MLSIIFSYVLIVVFVLMQLIYRRNQTIKFGAPVVPLEPDVVSNILNLAEIKRVMYFMTWVQEMADR
jgi:hypothetical protein